MPGVEFDYKNSVLLTSKVYRTIILSKTCTITDLLTSIAMIYFIYYTHAYLYIICKTWCIITINYKHYWTLPWSW